MESSLFQIESLLWLLGTVAYIEAFRRLDRFVSRRKRPATDEEHLARMALHYRVSEHDLFFYAAPSWNHSESRVEADFKDYLVNGRLPHYVRDFIRKEKKLLIPPP